MPSRPRDYPVEGLDDQCPLWAGTPAKLGCECLLLKRSLYLASWQATPVPFYLLLCPCTSLKNHSQTSLREL